MQFAIVLYDGFTALDAVGPYETLGRLPDSETVFVAERPGPARSVPTPGISRSPPTGPWTRFRAPTS